MKIFTKYKHSFTGRCISAAAAVCLLASSILPTAVFAQSAYVQPVSPAVGLSQPFQPAVIKGMVIHPENPFEFDFIIDEGDEFLTEPGWQEESLKLVRYFLSALTLPENELWVNLSPYEADRIIPDEFGKTEMGRDMLAQDYLLKQLTASMVVPENEFGRAFWDRVYARAKEQFGTTDIPVNTFNKVWIVPDQARIYEDTDRVVIVESNLKVMLEEDYLALENNSLSDSQGITSAEDSISELSTEILKDVIIPALEQEVNTGENFAQLRQIYNSFILASWYKQNLRNSLLSRSYVDLKKVGGLETGDDEAKERIYNRYLEAFKAGVYDIIKEEYDAVSQTVIPRKYFSGGVALKSPETVDASPQEDFTARMVQVRLERPTGGAITFDGNGLTQMQEEQIDNAIREDFEAGRAVALADERLEDLDPDGITSSNSVTVWEVPALAAMDKFLAAHAGRGGEANDHQKRYIYLSPEKIRLISRLSPKAKREFWNHEVHGHIDMNITQDRRVPEEEVLDEYPVDTVIEEVLADQIFNLLQKTPDVKALRGDWRISDKEVIDLARWLIRDNTPLLPDEELVRKLINHILVVYTTNAEGRDQAQQWVTMLADKWGISNIKLGNLFKWMLQNQINKMTQVSPQSLNDFMINYITTNQRYPDLRKEFIYFLPPGLDNNEKLNLVSDNISRMRGMFSPAFLANKSVLKAPIRGTDYFIAMQYGLAESTHGIYLALGKEAGTSNPLQGISMRIGLDTQDDILRINLVQGIKTATPDVISREFYEMLRLNELKELTSELAEMLIDNIGEPTTPAFRKLVAEAMRIRRVPGPVPEVITEAFVEELVDNQRTVLTKEFYREVAAAIGSAPDGELKNKIGAAISEIRMREVIYELGMHPADALGYIAAQIAANGHVRIKDGKLADPDERFSAVLGISTEYLVTRKNGTPTINPMVRYNKLGLRRKSAIGKAPEGFGRWQTVKHLTDNLIPSRMAEDNLRADSIGKLIYAFETLEEIKVNITTEDNNPIDGLPRSVKSDNAMLSNMPEVLMENAGKEAVGGIDFNRAYLNIESSGNRIRMMFPDLPDNMPAVEVNGLVPVIINMTPSVNIPMFLGNTADDNEFLQLSHN